MRLYYIHLIGHERVECFKVKSWNSVDDLHEVSAKIGVHVDFASLQEANETDQLVKGNRMTSGQLVSLLESCRRIREQM